MKTIEQVLEQKKKAIQIEEAMKYLNDSEKELSKLNINDSLRFAYVEKFVYNGQVEKIQFNISVPELALLLQKRVDKNKAILDNLLKEF